ncbi:MAG TPA: magnesium transporter CorA family protein [Trebonia sp.]
MSKAPDASPATAAAAARTPTRTRLYRDGMLALENFPAEDISGYLATPGSVVWLDLCAPTAADFTMINAEFGLHELAIEDALHERQRPKLDRYPHHLFISAYTVDLDAAAGELTAREIAVFVTGDALITVRKDTGFDIDQVTARWDASPDLASHGIGFLLYGLLDVLVDGHFAIVQQLDDSIEELQDLLFSENRKQIHAVQRGTFQVRKDLVVLRRIVLPMREVINSLMRRDLNVVSEPMAPYYQDVYDHVLRVTEWTESLRDLVTTILETNITIQGNRMNLIMKKVTSWAAIIAVPTAITGFYGQNLPYPGFGRESGFIFSTAVIVALSTLLYLTFKHKDWL